MVPISLDPLLPTLEPCQHEEIKYTANSPPGSGNRRNKNKTQAKVDDLKIRPLRLHPRNHHNLPLPRPRRLGYANKQVCTYGTLAIRGCDVNWRNGCRELQGQLVAIHPTNPILRARISSNSSGR